MVAQYEILDGTHVVLNRNLDACSFGLLLVLLPRSGRTEMMVRRNGGTSRCSAGALRTGVERIQ